MHEYVFPILFLKLFLILSQYWTPSSKTTPIPYYCVLRNFLHYSFIVPFANMSLNSKTFVMQAAKIFPIRSLDSVQSARFVILTINNKFTIYSLTRNFSQTNGCFWRCLRALMINDYLKISSWVWCCRKSRRRKEIEWRKSREELKDYNSSNLVILKYLVSHWC